MTMLPRCRRSVLFLLATTTTTWWCFSIPVAAFCGPLPSHNNKIGTAATSTRRTTSLSSDSTDGTADGSGDGAAATSELTGTLARIGTLLEQDPQQQRRWTELYLDDADDDDDSEPKDASANAAAPPGIVDPITSSMNREMVYVLEPPAYTTPSCTIVFVGGAGLGQFPHVSYNEFLTRVSDRTNAAVIAVPYTIFTTNLDHFEWSKRVGERARKALEKCRDGNGGGDNNPVVAPSGSPTYCLAHSLGCKLATIYAAATDEDYDGMGFIAYNNFGFGRTISMAREFAESLGQVADSGEPGSDFMNDDKTRNILDQVFGFAEQAISFIGIDFTPNPTDTDRLIRMSFDEERQRKTRLFAFDDDKLETTQEFLEACDGPGPEVSGLSGTHLTPVYFNFGLDQLPDEVVGVIPDENLGGFKSATFGNEGELDALVDEVSGWMLGKGPSRKPNWMAEPAQLEGSPDEAPRLEEEAASRNDE